MKNLILAALITMPLSSCASLNREVYDNVHEGDSADHVEAILGKPDRFEASTRIAGASAWYYVRRGEACAFTIDSGIVKYRACGPNPNYINPVAAFFQGAGRSLSSSNSTTCTSTVAGSVVTTNCN